MKIKVVLGTVGIFALLMVAMAVFSSDFGGGAVLAQAPTPTVSVPATNTAPTTIAPVKQDHSGRWGLFGLLGLAGLGGLLKRARTEVHTVETRAGDPVYEPRR